MGFFTSDEMTEEKFNGKALCHFDISKDEVEGADFERIDTFFDELLEFDNKPRQKVFFTFDGYNDDKRELIYIIEVVRYVKAMITRHPYFWYFATPYNSEFFYLALLVDEKDIEIVDFPFARKFHLKTDPERIKRLIRVIGMNLNIFGEEINDISGAVESLKAWSEKMLGALIH